MNDSQWMTAEGSKYETVVTVINPPAPGITQIVKANPRRFYLRISVSQPGGNATSLMPGPIPSSLATVPTTPLPVELKFKDCPSLCCGEWYCSNAPLNTYTIWECIYKGE